MPENKIELLSPAKNFDAGKEAINCGADAVYIGATKFGARTAAGNDIKNIENLVRYAHLYHASVYVTVNTILYDNELEEVRSLIRNLYNAGADAVIFQDMSILEMDIPPIRLIASTQTHNYNLERIKFLDSIGISRIILARELSIDQLKEIRGAVKAELEYFVHGALCVSLSGQCYLSEAMYGRSANRGNCAQPCRMKYTVTDGGGNEIIKNKYLLSLRDLNLSDHLRDLIDRGITSFKIEGRLKDIAYVKNVTSFYRQKLDEILQHDIKLVKSSHGNSKIPFTPAPEKTFNRGFTSYFFSGKDNLLTSADTPKSKGKYIGTVSQAGRQFILIDTNEKIINGDGLCYFNPTGELEGMNVNKVNGNKIFLQNNQIPAGTKIYRNYDHKFINEVMNSNCTRKIKTDITVEEVDEGIKITARDEYGFIVNNKFIIQKEIAANSRSAEATFKRQMQKSGDTIFEINDIKLLLERILFFPVKTLNDMRRTVLAHLEEERVTNFSRKKFTLSKNKTCYFENEINYKANIVNKQAKNFYHTHGVEAVEIGFELKGSKSGDVLMRCRYCIKDEIGMCPKKTGKNGKDPWYISGGSKKFKLNFDCRECFMEVVAC